MNPPKFILSGGGTGGHIFPAVAIANALRDNWPNAEILFVGANGRMEMEKVPAAGYKIIGLNIRGIQRKFSLSNLTLPLTLFKALVKAGKIIDEFKPAVAIGVGGYASGALLFMATRKNIPTLIQEQNSYAGVTNKLLGKRVNKICVAYPGMEKFFPKSKLVLSGNPVRKDLIHPIGRAEALKFFGLSADKPSLLVVGGSLGARSVNESILAALPSLHAQGIQLIWQTGTPFKEKAEEALKTGNYDGFVTRAFIPEMQMAYAAADLVVSRAGALAVAEIALLGKAAILVPFPFASEDHQTSNAKALSEHGAAVLIADKDAAAQLQTAILELMQDEKRRSELGSEAKKFGKPDATEVIVNEIKKLMER